MNTKNVSAATLSLCLLSASPLLADDTGADWPQWRGPSRTGVSSETGWNATSKDLWAKKIGFGHSSFAIADGRLFAMGYDLDAEQDVVYCLDPATGEEKWTHTYPAKFWNEGHDGGTCTTPTVDGNTVFTSNREGRLSALRADTGSVIWTRDTKEDHEVTPPRWGFSGSPLVADDMVVVNVGRIAAYDRHGEVKWATEKSYGNAYSTPAEYTFKGRPALIVLNGEGLVVIDREDGSEVAFHPWTRNAEMSVYGATPIVIGERVFISDGGRMGCAMLEPNDSGDGFDIVWEGRAMRSNYGAVLYEDHIYGFDASMLKCIDLDGNQKWRERGIGLGAVCIVGGRLLVISAKGELIIAEASPESYIELSRTKVLDGGAYWSTPVLSHGLAYARNSLGDMVCRDYRVSDAAMASRDVPKELPAAETLLAKHIEAIGGGQALQRLSSLHLTGRGESHGGGPIDHCDAELTWTPDAFVWRFSSGIDMGFNSQIGWGMTQNGPGVIEDDQIQRIRAATDLQRFLAPNWGYASVETNDARVFDDRMCYAVTATLEDGGERTLYFEVATGLLAGRDGDDVRLWVYDDYRSVGDVKVPMEWSFFSAGSGSMTLANFTEYTAGENVTAHLDPPPLIMMMTRSDEEKEQANTALRGKYGAMVGNYKLATGSMVGTPIIISIDEGGIRLSFGGQTPGFLTEPDEENRLFMMSQPQIYLQATPTGDGYEIVVFAYGDEFGRLEKAEDGG